MQCCSRTISASNFTFSMTLGALGSMAGATLIGPVKENFGWEITFLAFAALLLLAGLTLYLLDMDEQMAQIAALEKAATPAPYAAA